VSQGFRWSRTVVINPDRTQGTIKELKGPISIPMFTTNPNQHTAAHLLAWLPLQRKEGTNNKKIQKKTKTSEEGIRSRRYRLAPNRQRRGSMRPQTRRTTKTT
jgi:hypothetical protein